MDTAILKTSSHALNGAEAGSQPAAQRNARDRLAQALLFSVGVAVAWLPVEIRPLMAVVVSGTILALCIWGWSRSSRDTIRWFLAGVVGVVLLATSAASGWDPSRSTGEIGLLVGVAAIAWLGSRSRPEDRFLLVFALALAGLALWGLWQVAAGLDALREGVGTLPEGARLYAEERVSSRRAFASLPLPSHLAVLLATALPLLVTRVGRSPAGVIAAVGAVLSVIGLIATKSPVGVGLGLAATGAVFVGRYRRGGLVTVLLLAVGLVIVVAVRPDVTRLEPVSLRMDNWRTALWLSTTSPASGIGVSSFAQASQATPLEVGNRPAHAHNLPLESLAELGPAGLVGCLVLGCWLVGNLVRLWRRDRGLAAAVAVVPLHNLVDFSLFVSAVAIPWAVVLGWALVRDEGSDEPHPGRRGRILVVIGAAVAVAATTLHATSAVVEETAASRPHAKEQFEGALRALRLAPWRVEPQFLLATAAIDSGSPLQIDRAWREIDAHRWVRPRSAALAERRAWLALHRGDVSMAVTELWAAVGAENPESERQRSLRGLISSLEGGIDDRPPG